MRGWFAVPGVVCAILAGVISLPDGRSLAADNPPAEQEPPILTLDTGTFSASDIRCLAISHDDRLLAVGGGKEVRIWSIESGELQFTLRGYREPDGFNIGNVNALAFSPDSRILVVGVTDNTELGSTRVYDLSQPGAPLQLLPGHTGCTLGATVSPDGRYFATYGCAGMLEVFQVDLAVQSTVRTVEVPLSFAGCRASDVDSMANYFGFPLDDDWILGRDAGKEFVASRSRQAIYTKAEEWPLAIREFIRWEPGIRRPDAHLPGQFTTQLDLRLGRNSGYVRGGTSVDDKVGYYWVGVWTVGRKDPRTVYRGHRYYPRRVTWSNSRRLVASSDELGEIHVWHASTGEPVQKIVPQGRELYGVTWVGNDRVWISDRHYAGKQFVHNAFGPPTLAFDLKSLRLSPVAVRDAAQSVQSARARPVGRLIGKTVRLQVEHDASNVEQWNLQIVDLNSKARPVPLMFYSDRPMAFSFLGPDSLLVGTLRGRLEEWRAEVLKARPPTQPSDLPLTDFFVTTSRRFQGHSSFITGLAVSPDGQRLASTSTDGTLRIWSLAPVPPGADVPFSTEGNRLKYEVKTEGGMTLQADDTVLMFAGRSYYERKRRIANGEFQPGDLVELLIQRGDRQFPVRVKLVESSSLVEPLATVFLSKDQEWIAWTPRGTYAASPQGERYVGWHVNQGRQLPASYFTVGQFRKDLYHPQELASAMNPPVGAVTVVARRLPGSDAPTPVEATASTGPDFRDSGTIETRRPPVIRLLAPLKLRKTSQDQVPIKFEVQTPVDLREQAVRVSVNSRPLQPGPAKTGEADVEGPQGPAGQLVSAIYELSVPLTAGKNRIEVAAVHHRAEAQPLVLNVERTASESPAKPQRRKRLFVLAIGINTFHEVAPDLRVAAKDARDFAATLSKQQGALYEEVVAHVLTNEEATVARIKDEMGWLSESVKPDDTAFILLSSHGFYDSLNIWRLLTSDVRPEKRMTATTLRFDEIRAWFEDSLPASAVLFVDACHSSGINGVHQNGQPGGPGLRPSPWQGTRRLIFSSCLADEESQELRDNGAFTKALLEAFAAPVADQNVDGFLSARELALYLENRVPELTKKAQNPTVCDPGTAAQFLLYQFPKP